MNLRRTAAIVALMAFGLAPAAQAEDVIKIGVLADMAASSADAGGPGSVAAAQLAIDDFGGMINGKKIVLLSADHQMKPDIGASIARKWYDVDKVDVIMDVPVSSVALAVQELARERKKSLMVTAATVPDLTGKACSPYTLHWADDIVSLSAGAAKAVLATGGDTWFFLTVDFVFGHTMERVLRDVIEKNNGKVLGSVRNPLGTSDFSSFLLQAQSSKAKVVGLLNVGSDFITAVKQASEFGLIAGGQKMVGFLVFISDIHSLGLKATHGLQFVTSFYWDQDDKSRAFAKRFMEKRKVMPTKIHAQGYSALVHYLNAVKATNSTDAEKTTAWMKANKADYFGQKATIREDGRVIFDLALYEVKAQAESKSAWDYYKKVTVLKGQDAFLPVNREICAFLREAKK